MSERIFIDDIVDTFAQDDSQRDETSSDEIISFRKGNGCGCIRRDTLDDYIPRESIMLFDLNDMDDLEKATLIAIFEKRKDR